MTCEADHQLLPRHHQGHGTRLFVSCFPTIFNRSKLKKEELYGKEEVFHHEDSTIIVRDGTCIGCADSPWRFSIWEQPWASWPEQTLLGRNWSKGLSWSIFQPVLFCDYSEGVFYETNRTAVFWSHSWKEKTQTNLTKKLSKPPPSKTHNTHPTPFPPRYFLYKDRGINRHIYPQNRMKCPLPLKGPSPSCCQTCKMRNRHRMVLYVTSEDETEQRLLPQVTNCSMGFLCTEGVFPLWLRFCFILLFKNNFDH